MTIQRTKFVTATGTIDTAAYAAGDIMGPPLVFDPGGPGSGGLIHSMVVVDQAKRSLAMTVSFFTTSLAGSTLTDQAAPDILDTELAGVSIGDVPVAAGDYVGFADNSRATVRNVGLAFVKDGDGKFRALLIAGGAYDADAATDIVVILGLLLD